MRNTDAEIKRRIKKLHESGTKDWQTLAKQVYKHRKRVEYNLAQQSVLLSKRRVVFFKGGRGVGKTTIQGRRMRDIVFSMPRSLNNFVGTSYEQLLSQTIGSIVKGLELHGLYKDLHYFVGKKAPTRWNWEQPFQSPSSWKHMIHFFNGSAYRLISLERFGSGQGLNTDSMISDESAQQAEEALKVEVHATMRGSDSTFFKSPFFRSEMYTSTPSLTPKGAWFDDRKKDSYNPKADTDYFQAATVVNEKFLAPGWLESERQTTLPSLFEIIFELKERQRIPNLFYPLLSEDKHFYITPNFSYLENFDFNKDQIKKDCRKDKDLDEKRGLVVGLDFGASINCLVVAQRYKSKIRFVNDMYVLDPMILDDLADKFIEYYKYHPTKKIDLCYDSTGNNKQANSRKTLAQEFRNKLKKAGWSVQMKSKRSKNPEYSKKYRLWNKVLKPQFTWSESVEFNKFNCANLIFSMQYAPTKLNEKGLIEKDKSSERDKKLEQYKATHLSDCADYVVWYLLAKKVLGRGTGGASSGIGGGVITN